jgi:hypothetical protein
MDVWMLFFFFLTMGARTCFVFLLLLLHSRSLTLTYTHLQLEICKRIRYEQEQSGQKMLLDVRLNDDLVLVHAAVSS